MLRMIGRVGSIFSSSQAQSAVKSETDGEEDSPDDIYTTPVQSPRMNLLDEAHPSPRLNEDEDQLDTTPADADAHISEDAKEEKVTKRKTGGATKPGKTSTKSSSKKASAKESQIQQQLLSELGGESEAQEEAKYAGLRIDRGTESDVAVIGEKKGGNRASTKANGIAATTTKRRSSRQAQSKSRSTSDVDTEGESGMMRRRTRSESRALESAEESAAEVVAVNPVRARKSIPATTKKTKRKVTSLPGILEDENGDEVADDEPAISQNRKQVARNTKIPLPSPVVKPAKSRAMRAAGRAFGSRELQSDEQSQDIEMPVIVEKSKRGARKAADPVLSESEDQQESVAAQEESTMRPRNNASRLPIESAGPNAAVASLQPDSEEDHEATPRPSKKALGKRRAADCSTVPQKRQRIRKENSTDTPPLTKFGFTSHSDGVEPEQTSTTPEALGEAASILLKDAMLADSPTEQGKETDFITPNARRPTPMFTPINRIAGPSNTTVLPSSRLEIRIPSKGLYAASPSNMETVAPVASSSGKDTTKTPSAADPSTAESPEQSHTEIRRSTKAKTPVVMDEESDSGSDGLFIDPQVPKQNERRKRRLPTGEQTPKTPKARAESKAIKQRSESRTPKAAKPRMSQGIPKELQGRLSAEVYSSIAELVETWLSEKDVTQEEFNNMIQGGMKTSKPFLDAVLAENPDIPQPKLISALRRKYHNFDARGVWTMEDDQLLAELYGKVGTAPNKWKQIGEAMNRFSEDCRDRYRNYVICGDKQLKDAWTKSEEDTFRGIVAEVLKKIRREKSVTDDPEEQSTPDDGLIDWNRVSVLMGHTRSRLQCMNKYKKLKEREDPNVNDSDEDGPIAESGWRLDEARREVRFMSPATKLTLLQAIRDSSAGHESKIPWASIVKDVFEMPGYRMSLRVCFDRLKRKVEGYEEMELQDIVKVLLDAFEAAAPDEPAEYRITHIAEKSEGGQYSAKKRSHSRMSRESSGVRQTMRSISRKPRDHTAAQLDDKAEEDDNGEGPSNRRLTIAKTRKSGLIQQSTSRKSSESVKKLKMRERMVQEGNSNTIGDENADASEEILTSMESLKTGRTPKPKRTAKKPLVAARRSQIQPNSISRSAERVRDRDEFDPVLVEEQSRLKQLAKKPILPTTRATITAKESRIPSKSRSRSAGRITENDDDADPSLVEQDVPKVQAKKAPIKKRQAQPISALKSVERVMESDDEVDPVLAEQSIPTPISNSAEPDNFLPAGNESEEEPELPEAEEQLDNEVIETENKSEMDQLSEGELVEEGIEDALDDEEPQRDELELDNEEPQEESSSAAFATYEERDSPHPAPDTLEPFPGAVEYPELGVSRSASPNHMDIEDELRAPSSYMPPENSMEIDQESESADASVDAELDNPFDLPAASLQRFRTPSAEPSGNEEEESDDENEVTILTHDQESVDLDNDQPENDEMADVDDEEEQLGYENESVDEELPVNGAHYSEDNEETQDTHMDEPLVNGVLYSDEEDPDLPMDEQEQRGFPSDTQVPASRWEGYGDSLSYNRDHSQDSEPTPVPANSVEEDQSDSISNPSTIVFARFVQSSARRDDNDSSEDSESSEEDEDEESQEEELVERYADDDVDDDYEEKVPRRRRGRASGVSDRDESPEL